jgi:toxin ParE1/3/4
MRVTLTKGAVRQLQAIFAYTADDNPLAAARIVARVEEISVLLAANPLIGRKLPHRRLRWFPLTPFPYLIYYEASGSTARIVRIWHMSRRRGSLHEPVPDFPPGGGMTKEEIQALLQSRVPAEKLWPLTEAERADLEEAIREVERGEIASDAQVGALFRLARR